MRWGLAIFGVAAVCLVGAPAALGATDTARAGNVTAKFSFQGKPPEIRGQRLQIVKAGRVLYDQPVVSKVCGQACVPLSRSPVRLIDLERNGPDVVLELSTWYYGMSPHVHCCAIVQVFSFDRRAHAYVKVERSFGPLAPRIADLRHDGRLEFVTADNSFAGRFTDYADSGAPVEILRFSLRCFNDVTRAYPRLVAKDAAGWLQSFNDRVASGNPNTDGVIAAWAADEDLLGQEQLVSSYLADQAQAGHLNSSQGGDGTRFIARLQKFLRRRGYLR